MAVIGGGFVSGPLPAEEGPIVITGERRPRPLRESVVVTEVIDRRAIESLGAQNAADVLEKHPGVEVRPALRGQSVRLQGLDPQYVLILIDGQRVTGRVDGAIDLTRFKTEEIERIEIVKGASSALYGSDAIGGVINIITRETNVPGRAQFETQYGSGRRYHFDGGNETSTSGVLGLSNEYLSTTFVNGWHRSDGYNLTPVTKREKRVRDFYQAVPGFNSNDLPPLVRSTTGTEFRDLNAGNTSVFHLHDRLDVRAHVNYRYLDQDRADLSPPRAVLDRNNKTHDFLGSLSPVLRLSQNGSLTLAYSHARFLDHLDVDQRGSDELDRLEAQDDRTHEGRAQLDYRVFDTHQVALGVEGGFDELVSPRIQNGYAYRQRVGVFAQDEWAVGGTPKWVLVPGVRYDTDSQYGSQATPKLATRLDPTDWIRLRASVGNGYRAPAFKDLYISFQNPGVGYQVLGNPNLEPESSTSYNAGIEVEPTDWLWISANGFYNSISNLIDFQPLAERRNDLATYQPQNIDKAYTRGIEFSTDTRFRSGVLSGFSAGLGYVFTETRDRSAGLPLPGRAKHQGSYRLGYESAAWGTGLEIGGRIYGKQPFYYTRESIYTLDRTTFTFRVDQNAAVRAFAQGRNVGLVELNSDFPRQDFTYRNPYHLLDVRVYQKIFETYEVYAGVDNVLDEYDPELNPIRPRFFYFGVRARFESGARDEEIRRRLDQGVPLDQVNPEN